MSLDNKKHLMVCYIKFLWAKKDFSVIEACKMTIRASLTLTLAFVCGCGNDAVESEIKALRKEVALLQGEIRELRKSIGHRPAFDREAHRERLEVMRRSTESRTNGIYRVHPPAMPSSPEEATDGQKVKEGAMRKMEMRRMEMRKKREEREARHRELLERRRMHHNTAHTNELPIKATFPDRKAPVPTAD